MNQEKILVADEISRQRKLISMFNFLAIGLANKIRPQLLALLGPQSNGSMYTFAIKKENPDLPGKFNEILYKDDTYKINLTEASEYAEGNPSINIEYFNIILSSSILKVGDLLTKNTFFDKSPELEFLRHLRNGLAHNNKFTFSKKEPYNPAHFGIFVITNQLEGKDVLYLANVEGYIEHGNILELFEVIESQLRK